MIAPLTAFLPQYPLLGWAPVVLPCGHGKVFLETLRLLKDGGAPMLCTTPDCGQPLPDLSTILCTSEPGEVGEMVGAESVCPDCGESYHDPSTLREDVWTGRVGMECCRCATGTLDAVTARWFLWDGREVEWSKALPLEQEARYSEDGNVWAEVACPLDAVVMVGEHDHGTMRICEPCVAARAACEAAGVAFYGPGR